jgi:anti-sigma B factor antagonist
MKVKIRTLEKVSIIDCWGDVDLHSSTLLREALLVQIQSGIPSVLVNMGEVGYIDSSGIATLVEGLQLSRSTKTRFGLFGLRRNARSVLELARLHKVFNLFNDESEALEKIGSVQPFSGV